MKPTIPLVVLFFGFFLTMGMQCFLDCNAKTIVVKPKAVLAKSKPMKTKTAKVQPSAQESLPKTNALINDDNLLPTQNRTQAMQLEAQTGHIAPYQDKVINHYLKNKRSER